MRSSPFIAVASALLAVTLVGCGETTDPGASTGAAAAVDKGGMLTGLRVMVPNAAGSGYDVTARTSVTAMESASIASKVDVFNIPGAGGTVGLAQLVHEKGNGDLAMMMGLGVVGSVYTNDSNVTLTDTTPLARLIEEAGAIVVSKKSPYNSLEDLVKAWKAHPATITVGGGSAPGGPDHLLPMQLAQAVGINPKQVNYIAYDGGGELLTALLADKVAFGASGYSEFLEQIESGDLKVLATTGEKRVSVVDAPTLKQAGVNLVFTNWRGLVAPPGIDKAKQTRLVAALDKLHESAQWKAALVKNDWTDAYMTGDEFSAFLTEQDKRVASILAKVGVK